MSYEKDMSGIIGKNERKSADNHPDITGNCTINGVEFWVNGWRKARKDGSGHFYSLSFREKEAPQKPAPKRSAAVEDSQDIPFANPYRGPACHVV